MYTAVAVQKHYKGRRYNLPFTHHKEALFIKIPEEAQNMVLKKAEMLQLTSKHVRALCNVIKRGIIDNLTAIKSITDAEELIKSKKNEKVDFLVMDELNSWTKIKTKTQSPPEGHLVINLKENTVTTNGQTTMIGTP